MKPFLLLTLTLALVVGKHPSLAAGADALAPVSQSGLVGDLGRRDSLVIEGNKTFAKDQILEALSGQLDFHLAAHRAAPLPGYLSLIEHKITLGYQRTGFPDVAVHTTVDSNPRRIMVRVNEGLRYRCGDILLSGVKTMTTEAVRQKIKEKLTEKDSNATDEEPAIWGPGIAARFDSFSRGELELTVQEALSDMGYYQPHLSVAVVPDPARKLADLQIEITDEGIKGVLSQIEISGLRTNTRQAVLDYLQLKPGMVLQASLVTTVSNQLRNSARFLHNDVILTPQPAAGMFKLELDLDEHPDAPPLDRSLSPQEQTLLKFRDWLADLSKQSEDLACSVEYTAGPTPVRIEAALAASGFALATRSVSSNLSYAFVVSGRQVGFHPVWRKSKFAVENSQGRPVIFIKLLPNERQSSQRFNLSVGAGFNVREGEPGTPFKLLVDLIPAAFIEAAHAEGWRYSLQDGVATFQCTNLGEGNRMELKVAAATGRLIQFTGRMPKALWNVQSEAGAFARLQTEIAAASAGHTNEYVAGHGLSSWLSSMATDFLESRLMEQLVMAWISDDVPQGKQDDTLATMQRIVSGMAQAGEVIRQLNVAGALEPLDRLVSSKPASEDEFIIPLKDSMAGSGTDSMVGMICGWVLGRSDALLTRDS